MEKKKITASEEIPEFNESIENMPEATKEKVDNKLKAISETCTLTDAELIAACEKWIDRLCKSGGDAWTLEVPVNMNRDPDMLFTELIRRFSNPQPGPVWVKASERLPGWGKFVEWRHETKASAGKDTVLGIAKRGYHYFQLLEWLDESATPAAPYYPDLETEAKEHAKNITSDPDYQLYVAQGYYNAMAKARATPAAGREESDAIEFAEWCQENTVAQYEKDKLHSWRIFGPNADGKDYTTAQLYQLFKEQKEGNNG